MMEILELTPAVWKPGCPAIITLVSSEPIATLVLIGDEPQTPGQTIKLPLPMEFTAVDVYGTSVLHLQIPAQVQQGSYRVVCTSATGVSIERPLIVVASDHRFDADGLTSIFALWSTLERPWEEPNRAEMTTNLLAAAELALGIDLVEYAVESVRALISAEIENFDEDPDSYIERFGKYLARVLVRAVGDRARDAATNAIFSELRMLLEPAEAAAFDWAFGRSLELVDIEVPLIGFFDETPEEALLRESEDLPESQTDWDLALDAVLADVGGSG